MKGKINEQQSHSYYNTNPLPKDLKTEISGSNENKTSMKSAYETQMSNKAESIVRKNNQEMLEKNLNKAGNEAKDKQFNINSFVKKCNDKKNVATTMMIQ